MNKRYLFYHIAYVSPENAHYDHCCIALAEGMSELGITFFGNIDYWKEYGKEQYLIAKQPRGYEADVHIYSDSFVQANFDIIEKIIDTSKFNVLVDSSGFPWLNMHGNDISSNELLHIYADKRFQLFDLTLRSHYPKGFKFGPKVKPWAFGITNRMLTEIEKSRDEKPSAVVISNFRNNLDIRKLAISKLDPLLSKKFRINYDTTDNLEDNHGNIQFDSPEEKHYWQLTGRRHRSPYFQSLNQSLLTYTFGGLIGIKSSGPNNTGSITTNRIAKKLKGMLGIDFADNIIIYQFDSWRIWEALISNSCPINMDFEEWGLQLPVMPINGKHYWGIHKLRFNEGAAQLMAMTEDEIRTIGKQGSEWAIEHYSPVPTTARFLMLVNDRVPSAQTV